MGFFIEYFGEFILLIVAGLLSVCGKKETAEKLLKKRRKRRRKQEKKVRKEAKKLEDDLAILEEM